MRGLATILVLASCSSEAPAFPADYASMGSASYTEVRNCRGPSTDHQDEYIRVMASPDALDAYQGRVASFPVGAVVLKEQYAITDPMCAGKIAEYSVMVRLETGSAPTTLDWTWQHVSASREVLGDNILDTCVSCHSQCASQGVGYMGTCEEP